MACRKRKKHQVNHRELSSSGSSNSGSNGSISKNDATDSEDSNHVIRKRQVTSKASQSVLVCFFGLVLIASHVFLYFDKFFFFDFLFFMVP